MATRRLLGRDFLQKLGEAPNLVRLSSSRITSVSILRCSYNTNNNCHSTTLVPQSNFYQHHYLKNSGLGRRLYSSSLEDEEPEKKPSLFQRFKQMYKDYWYVLVPVHLVTSAAWFGGFYYLAQSGVDIVGLLESWDVSERITNSLKDSKMGYFAIAYALYKISTPARYTVTLGGTTVSINYLKKWGYIKPVPSREKLKEMYQTRKENLLEKMHETREGIKETSEKLMDKREHMIEDLDKGLKQIKELGEKYKSKESIVKKIKEKD